MKKIIIIIISLAVLIFIGYFGYHYLLGFKNTEFVVSQETTFDNSVNHVNGTWWGFNQSKIARIDEYVFTYYVDNSTQIGDVANANNPNQMVFIMIDNSGKITEFDSKPTSRPGNVVADNARQRIYYFTLEPTSSEDNGYLCKLVMYVYQLEAGEAVFHRQEVVIDNQGIYPETINIRLAVTIDKTGNIGVTYSIPNPSYIFSMYVHTYDILTETWEEKSVLIDGLNHPNFYPELIMKDINHFLVVAVQDYCYGGDCYYQYTRYFIYNEGQWSYDYLADYRDLEIAKERANLTAHSEVYIGSDNQYHVLTISRLSDEDNEAVVNHYILNESSNTFSKTSFSGKYNHIRMVTVNDIDYFVAVDNKHLMILNNNYEIIHQQDTTKSVYIYVCSDNADFFDLLVTTGNSEDIAVVDNVYYRIEKID